MDISKGRTSSHSSDFSGSAPSALRVKLVTKFGCTSKLLLLWLLWQKLFCLPAEAGAHTAQHYLDIALKGFQGVAEISGAVPPPLLSYSLKYFTESVPGGLAHGADMTLLSCCFLPGLTTLDPQSPSPCPNFLMLTCVGSLGRCISISFVQWLGHNCKSLNLKQMWRKKKIIMCPF